MLLGLFSARFACEGTYIKGSRVKKTVFIEVLSRTKGYYSWDARFLKDNSGKAGNWWVLFLST